MKNFSFVQKLGKFFYSREDVGSTLSKRVSLVAMSILIMCAQNAFSVKLLENQGEEPISMALMQEH